MKTANKDFSKQSQKNYSLALRLQVVDEIEKGHLTYKGAKGIMAFRVEVRFLYG